MPSLDPDISIGPDHDISNEPLQADYTESSLSGVSLVLCDTYAYTIMASCQVKSTGCFGTFAAAGLFLGWHDGILAGSTDDDNGVYG